MISSSEISPDPSASMPSKAALMYASSWKRSCPATMVRVRDLGLGLGLGSGLVLALVLVLELGLGLGLGLGSGLVRVGLGVVRDSVTGQ